MIAGKQIIINEHITKQVQCRTHRKKRINKKWLKRYGTRTVPDNQKILVTQEYVFMTQKCFDKISNLVEHFEEVIGGRII